MLLLCVFGVCCTCCRWCVCACAAAECCQNASWDFKGPHLPLFVCKVDKKDVYHKDDVEGIIKPSRQSAAAPASTTTTGEDDMDIDDLPQ